MNKENDYDEMVREPREHREQDNNNKELVCSPSDSASENTGNKLITKIITPMDNIPETLEEAKIQRPCYISHSDWFRLGNKKMKPGVYHHSEQTDKYGLKTPVDEFICSPLEVIAITSSCTSEDFGRLLSFIDSNGNWHTWAMPMDLLKGGGDECRGALLNRGFTFDPRKRNQMIEYLMESKPKKRLTAATSVGWHKNSFVFPDETIGADDVVFQSNIICGGDFSAAGSLLDWQNEIGRLCVGNVPLMVSVSAALAGPLLAKLNRQHGGGIHWVGDSSIGKSTAIEVGASIWGAPEFIRSWSATSNGLEGIAASRNDTCLILDEIDEALPNEVGKIVYMLINGQGKQRAGRSGNARSIQRWRLMTLSTGERTLGAIMKEGGKQQNAGQMVRLLNIPAKLEHGIFSNLHGFSDGRSLADHLKNVKSKFHGTVGAAFIKKLIADNGNLSELDTFIKEFTDLAATSIEKRAATVFAVIGLAGELGIEYGLLPWNKGSALEAALIAYKKWREFQGEGQTEDQIILQAIRDFLGKYGDSRFDALGPSSKNNVNNRVGWFKEDRDQRVYMFTSAGLMEAGGGYHMKRIVEALLKNDAITEKDKDRNTKKTRISCGSYNLYYVKMPDNDGDA